VLAGGPSEPYQDSRVPPPCTRTLYLKKRSGFSKPVEWPTIFGQAGRAFSSRLGPCTWLLLYLLDMADCDCRPHGAMRVSEIWEALEAGRLFPFWALPLRIWKRGSTVNPFPGSTVPADVKSSICPMNHPSDNTRSSIDRGALS
jgi:hypothetical protein